MTPNRASASAGRLGDFFFSPPRGTVAVTPNRTSASAGRLGCLLFFPPVGTVTVTPNRGSASAGRLGDFFFFLPWDDYRDPEPAFRISGAVKGCLLLFPPGGTVTVTPNRTSASAGRLGMLFCFPLPWDDYRDPEPGFRISGAAGGFFSFPSRGMITVTPNRASASVGRLGDVCCFCLRGLFTAGWDYCFSCFWAALAAAFSAFLRFCSSRWFLRRLRRASISIFSTVARS